MASQARPVADHWAGGLALPARSDIFDPRYARVVRIVILLTASVSASISAITSGHLWPGVVLAGVAALYLGLTGSVRALDRGSVPTSTAITVLDILLITGIVWITGGVRSEYYLLYYVPVIHAAIRLNIRDGIAACVLAVALYALFALRSSSEPTLVTNVSLRALGTYVSASVLVVFLTLLRRETELTRSLKAALHDSLGRVAAVYDVSRVANTGADLASVLSALLEHAGRGTGAKAGAIAMMGAEGRLQLLAVRDPVNDPSDQSRAPAPITPPDCTSEPAYRAIAAKAPVLVSAQPSASPDTPGPGNIIYLPLATPGGPTGVLGLAAGPGRRFARNQIEFLKSLCSEAAIAIENAQLRAELRRMAITDYLTGLANRREIERLLSVELDRALRYHRPLTVLMVDIDDLKSVNDQHGHAAGDETLCALGRVLQKAIRSSDSAGRVGGDEFLVVVPEATAAEGQALGRRLIQHFKTELAELESLPELALLANVSVGVASNGYGVSRGSAEQRMSTKDLMSLADDALYEAKRAGKGRVRVTSTEAPVSASSAPPE